MIIFDCPSCRKKLRIGTEFSGKRARCPHCQSLVSVKACASDLGSGHEAHSIHRAVTAGLADPNQPVGDTDTSVVRSRLDSQHLIGFLAPPQAPGELGRLGPYRVLAVLGHGGMGVVFEAEDPQLRRKVALKAMLPSLAASASARQRFLREAQAAATVEHDHVVAIHQVGEDHGVPFIAMAFLRGESLEARLTRQSRLPLAEVLRIGRETADGLAAAHQHGLVHRDIKPANLWLEEHAGRVKILDFGLARAAGDSTPLTQMGAIVGTPNYMSPEQVYGHSVDARCDLFSLGCVLYQISTGRRPFQGSDTISTLLAVATAEPPPPDTLNSALPPDLSELIRDLLAKDPAQRPSSAQVLREALAGIEKLESEPTRSYRGSLPPTSLVGPAGTKVGSRRGRSAARPSRHRLGLVLAGLGAMVLLLAAGLVLMRIPTRRRELVPDGRGQLPSPSDQGAGSPGAGTAQAKEEGFVPLFNGTDLSGWFEENDNPKRWNVAAGEVFASSQGEESRTNLLSTREYRNFRLRLEFNLARGAVCRIALRAFRCEKSQRPKGELVFDHPALQLQSTSSPAKGTMRWLLNANNLALSQAATLRPDGEWNRLEVELKDRLIRAWVNDGEILSATLAAGVRMADGFIPALNRLQGRIGLQSHTGTVRFRHIEVKELPAESALEGHRAARGFAAQVAEKDRGKWCIVDGCLEQPTMTDRVWITFGDTSWTDYDFSVECLRLQGDDGIEVAFRVHWLGEAIVHPREFGALSLHRTRNTVSALHGRINDGKPWQAYAQQKGPTPADRWVPVLVKLRGRDVRCFVDGQELFHHTLERTSTGSVGLMTWHDRYRFRNIKVTDPRGKVLLEGLPEFDPAWYAR
jgi:serine/threonine protein kinase